jgi:hypothetical protein
MAKVKVVLNFPNPTRVHDASKRCVYFWGYDNAREIVFQIDDVALARLGSSKDCDEPSLLAAFDRNRDRILAIARTVYKGGPQNRYTVS